MALLSVVGAIGLLFLDIPLLPHNHKDRLVGRSIGDILRQPETIVAMLCAMISYGIMTLVMTSTALAMLEQGFSLGQAADVVRWHALAMFGPSFVTGTIISRFGHLRVMSMGLLLLGVSCMIAIAGVDLDSFYVALILLGLGWNFGFVGATSLLSYTHTAGERTKVQGLNDFLVLGTVSIASLGSGALLNLYGWSVVQMAAIPAIAIASIALIWLGVSKRGGTFVTL